MKLCVEGREHSIEVTAVESIGGCALQSKRPSMEDFFFASEGPNIIAAVFDGHGGRAVHGAGGAVV